MTLKTKFRYIYRELIHFSFFAELPNAKNIESWVQSWRFGNLGFEPVYHESLWPLKFSLSHLITFRYPNKNEIWFKEKISISDDFQQVGSDLGDGEDGDQIRNIVDTVGDVVENVVPGGSAITSVLKPTFYGFTKDLQNQVTFQIILEGIWKQYLKGLYVLLQRWQCPIYSDFLESFVWSSTKVDIHFFEIFFLQFLCKTDLLQRNNEEIRKNTVVNTVPWNKT